MHITMFQHYPIKGAWSEDACRPELYENVQVFQCAHTLWFLFKYSRNKSTLWLQIWPSQDATFWFTCNHWRAEKKLGLRRPWYSCHSHWPCSRCYRMDCQTSIFNEPDQKSTEKLLSVNSVYCFYFISIDRTYDAPFLRIPNTHYCVPAPFTINIKGFQHYSLTLQCASPVYKHICVPALFIYIISFQHYPQTWCSSPVQKHYGAPALLISMVEVQYCTGHRH